MATPELSVCFGTLNRIELLKPCLDSIRASARGITSEIIITDGGSTDGTLIYLREQKDVVLIEQGARLGAMKAFNAAFCAARGQYVCNLNDDCLVVGDTLKRACEYLDMHSSCGQVAIPFGDGNSPPQTQIIPNKYAQLCGKKNPLYANFGVIRKDLGDKFGWWGDRLTEDKALYQYGGDVFLSIMVWISRSTVDVLNGGSIIHYQIHDETRRPNVEQHALDRIFIPYLALEHEREQMRRANKRITRDMHAQARLVKQTVTPISNPTKLRYLGNHRALALFTDTLSGHVYRIKLKVRQEFYVDGADVVWFVEKKGERGAAEFEKV